MQATIRPIAAVQTQALRYAVLRPNRPLEDAVFPGDDAPETLHLGAFDGSEIVGIASIYPEIFPGDAQAQAYRLRGMAVEPRFHRCGIGAALIRGCLSHVAARGGTLLWCNARVGALSFYRSLGFETVGDEFEIEAIGPHFVMKIGICPL